MTHSVSVIEASRPAELGVAAGALGARIDGMTGIVGVQCDALSTMTAAWRGGAADAARRRGAADIARQQALLANLAALQASLRSGGTQLDLTRSALLQIIGALRAGGWRITDSGIAIPPPGFPPVLQLLAPRFTTLIQRLQTLFTAIDTRTAADVLAASRGEKSGVPSADAAGGDAPGVPGGDEYVIGPPTKPHVEWDEDFQYASREPTFADYEAAAEWRAKLAGGELIRPDLDDALAAYRHYWDNTGTPMEFDYGEAYREDANVRTAVDNEIVLAAAAADRIAQGGNAEFQITGDPRTVGDKKDPRFPYPATENWQKTIGGYQQWSHSKVRVEGNRVSMDVTVEADDHYNFNRGDSDIATGTPDNENGRFTEVGWAKPFDAHGSITTTISWELGHPPASASDVPVSGPVRTFGEDRVDNRDSSGPRVPGR